MDIESNISSWLSAVRHKPKHFRTNLSNNCIILNISIGQRWWTHWDWPIGSNDKSQKCKYKNITHTQSSTIWSMNKRISLMESCERCGSGGKYVELQYHFHCALGVFQNKSKQFSGLKQKYRYDLSNTISTIRTNLVQQFFLWTH